MRSSLVTRNVRIHDRRTSVRLEPQLWRALETIAEIERVDINEICSRVEETRGPDGGFTSALRVYIVEYFTAEARRRLRDREVEKAEPVGARGAARQLAI
ncbi:MAG: ribbon-helix-helix domain-containing protein [Pseudomonadota bacterium]